MRKDAYQKKCIYLRKVTRNRVLINKPIAAHPSFKKISALDEKQKLPVHQSKQLVPLMYVCPCIIYEIVGYKLTYSAQDYTPAPQNLSHNT